MISLLTNPHNPLAIANAPTSPAKLARSQRQLPHLSARERQQLSYLSHTIMLEEAGVPDWVRMILMVTVLTVLSFCGWASFAPVNEITKATGDIIPPGHVQAIQHFDGGIIKELNVQDGQFVKAGQVLVVMNGAGTTEDLAQRQAQAATLAHQISTLKNAFQDGKLDPSNPTLKAMQDAKATEISVFRAQQQSRQNVLVALNRRLAEMQTDLDNVRNITQMQESLMEKGAISRQEYLQTQHQQYDTIKDMNETRRDIAQAQSDLAEINQKITARNAERREDISKQLDELIGLQAQNNEQIIKLQAQQQRLEIRAPINGMIKGLTANSMGKVVKPGETLFEIVPTDLPMEVEAQVPAHDIGQLHPGQTVRVKITAYDFTRYGTMDGTLKSISASTFTDEHDQKMYHVRIALPSEQLGSASRKLLPGMTVETDIITGKRTVMAYLMKPLQRAFDRALTEH